MALDTSKIIHAPIGGGKYTVTSPLTKSDYGIMLVIENAELPTSYQVDFSNNEHSGTSITMIGGADGVEIPKQYIDTGKDVFAWLYWVGEDYGKTVYKFRIPNKLRPDRTNEEPTPEEQSVIDQAISALNSAVAQTAQDVIDADASAQASAESAQVSGESALSASNSALSAGEYASNALSHAESASASATASAQSASQSAQIKDDVEGMVDDAQASASASAQSATASANSASQASGYAQSASASAQSASGYASQAQTSAQTASTKASEASTSASTASTKATESAQSASQALTYKTDAESAKTASQTAQGLAESARDSAITAKDDAEDARDEAQALVDGISEKVEQIDSNTERIESLEDDRYKPYPTDTASGAVASFTDGADDIPLKSLVVDINPVQNLNGYDSPWVAGGGKNKLFLTATTTTINGVTFTVNDDGTIVVKGTATADIVFEIWSKAQNGGNVLLPSGQYIVNGGANGGGTSTYRVGSNGFAWSGGTLKTETDSLTFTITENEAQTNIWIQVFNGTSLSNVVFKPMIRLASVTDASFAPYENICPISGWTGCNIQHDGKNLLALPVIRFSEGTATVGNCFYLKQGTYTLSYSCADTHRFGVRMMDANGTIYTDYPDTPISGFTYNSSAKCYYAGANITSGSKAYTMTIKHDCYVRIVSNLTGGGFTDVQLKQGSSATAYEPYVGQTIPISWQTEAGTVYGGKLDVLSGKLTVYPYYASYNGETLTGRWISDRDVYAVGTTPTIGAQVVNIGAEGTEYQLDPHEIASLLGTNNIFADTGNVTAEYRADTTLYISRLTEPDADMIADSNIVSGQYFMVGNSLFKATANIASGSAVTVGTNAIRKSLSEALNEINA